MRIPFSYRHHFFAPVLAASFLGHFVFFMPGSLFSVKPQFGIEAGPSSMEVFILKDEVKEKNILKEDQVFLAKEPAQNTPEVIQKKIIREQSIKQKNEKSIYVPPVHGALTEAKPAYLKNPAPLYPLMACENGWEGLAVLRVLVEKDGKPSQVLLEKSSGYEVLDGSALSTVKKWQFSPSRIGNMSFASWVKVPIRFVLEKNR